jgi:FimV-like protein|tara:strand:+ start:129 stop:752 length:624 start_codon:yes stop_codon:yes gene_type:complete
MNQRLKLQLAGYVDDGMDYSNSLEVRDIVDASDVAREFYETLLFANQRLENFFKSSEMHKTNKNLHKFIDETLEPKNTFWTRWVPASGLMMATVAMLITFGPFMTPLAEAPVVSNYQVNIPDTIPQPQTIKNYQVSTLWSLADSLTEEMDATIYQVMYGMFTANSTAFMNADIKSIRADVDLVMPDKTLIKMLDPNKAQQMVEAFLN